MSFTSTFRRPRLALAAGAGLALLAGCSPPEPLRPGDLLLASERPGDGAPVGTGAPMGMGAPVVSGVAPSWRPLPDRIADALARRMAQDESPPKAWRALAREIEPVLLRVRRAFPEAGVPILENVVPNTFVAVLKADLAAAVRRLLYESGRAAVLLRTGNAAFDSFNERNGLSKVSILEETKFLLHFDHPVDFIPNVFNFFGGYDSMLIYLGLPYVDGRPYMEGVEGVYAAKYGHAYGSVYGCTAVSEDTHGGCFGDSYSLTLAKVNGTWCLEVREFVDWGLYLHHQFAVEGDKVEEIYHGQAHKCAFG